jgi:leader peptidase (prepilin peptidase)/N-methyltransferase
MIPILSYLWLRGRCRYCGTAIPRRLLVVEAATGLLFTLIFLRYGLSLESLVLALVVSLLLAVAIIDLEHGLILNRLLVPALVAALILAPFWSGLELARPFLGSHSMLASLLNSLVAGAGAFLLFFTIRVLYSAVSHTAGMGEGDEKLAGLLGLLVGFPGILVTLWTAALSGGLAAAALLLLRKKGRKDPIPFAPFLVLGATVALVAGTEVVYWYRGLMTQVESLLP